MKSVCIGGLDNGYLQIKLSSQSVVSQGTMCRADVVKAVKATLADEEFVVKLMMPETIANLVLLDYERRTILSLKESGF